MIRALIEGRKTQTRRIANSIPWLPGANSHVSQAAAFNNFGHFVIAGGQEMTNGFSCPYGVPGDLLWVRETFTCYRQTSYEYDEWEQVIGAEDRCYYAGRLSPVFRADGKSFPEKWEPAIHMPRWVSRLTLEITDVRVERLHALSESDARAEGWSPEAGQHPYGWFRDLWKGINGDQSWDANPWVWRLSFSVHQMNVDAVLKHRGAA